MRTFITLLLLSVTTVANAAPCQWDTAMRSFTGSAMEQALCLLSPVSSSGSIGKPLVALPPTLEELIGKPFHLPRQDVETYLLNADTHPNELGGPLGLRVSLAGGTTARYFVIHTTGLPIFDVAPSPADINTSPLVNSFAQFGKRYHVLINRTGESRTSLDFFSPLRSTRFERKTAGLPAKGLFLHVALTQPYIQTPHGHTSPSPAYTSIQYKRLAESYVVASQRAKTWLTPVFAGVLDHNFTSSKSPRDFSLTKWADAVRTCYRGIAQ